MQNADLMHYSTRCMTRTLGQGHSCFSDCSSKYQFHCSVSSWQTWHKMLTLLFHGSADAKSFQSTYSMNIAEQQFLLWAQTYMAYLMYAYCYCFTLLGHVCFCCIWFSFFRYCAEWLAEKSLHEITFLCQVLLCIVSDFLLCCLPSESVLCLLPLVFCGCSYISKRLRTKFDVLAESLLPSLVALLPNSARVMSSSAVVTISFIIAVSLFYIGVMIGVWALCRLAHSCSLCAALSQ